MPIAVIEFVGPEELEGFLNAAEAMRHLSGIVFRKDRGSNTIYTILTSSSTEVSLTIATDDREFGVGTNPKTFAEIDEAILKTGCKIYKGIATIVSHKE